MLELNTDVSFNQKRHKTWNEALVHQVIVAKQSERRVNTARQKNRSAVRGGGRKPWRQKGTGRARAGTIRSPLWRSGGVTFANRGRNFCKKVNKKVYASAFAQVLLRLYALGAVKFVNDFSISQPSTKEALQLLQPIMPAKHTSLLLVTVGFDNNLWLSCRNLSHVSVVDVASFGILDAVSCDMLVITSSAHALLAKKYALE